MAVTAPEMDFDALLVRFFGTGDFAAMSEERLVDDVQALGAQFGMERDGGRRFVLMHMLGAAPNLEEAFEGAVDRDAARDFMEEVEREMEGGA